MGSEPGRRHAFVPGLTIPEGTLLKITFPTFAFAPFSRSVTIAISMIRGPNMCNYNPTNKAAISKKEPQRNLIKVPLRASCANAF
ncbi:hypothetical protein TNCV_1961331 [Trichonephila clavipes]|nr:hypothetical protein TNCV_1961331 [Trichonephila clavipes]